MKHYDDTWEADARRRDEFDHETFNLIGKILTERCPMKFREIFLDTFEFKGVEYSFIVVVFFGGGMSVRNARINSLTANIQELSALLNGGYFAEVMDYRELKKEVEEYDNTGNN